MPTCTHARTHARCARTHAHIIARTHAFTRKGDFIGDFALLGNRDWGSSSLINVPFISIEAYTAIDTFAVCLVLTAGVLRVQGLGCRL